MCTALAITGIALTAASTVANTIASNQAASAREDALAAERIRQQGLDDQAAAVNAGAQDRYTDFDSQQTDEASDLAAYYTDQTANQANENAAVSAEQAMPATSSNITIQENEKQRSLADAYGDQQGAALGNLRAFGEVLGGIGREQARDAGTIGQIGGFKRGSTNVLPLELEAANQKGAGLRSLADMFNLGGGLAVNSGLQGSFTTSGATVPKPNLPKASLGSLY